MYVYHPGVYIAISRIMGSSSLLPFIVDLMHQAEMDVYFRFSSNSQNGFWFFVKDDGRTSLKELNCLRRTISPRNLGKETIDETLLSGELKKRLDYCKKVWGMHFPEKPIDLSCVKCIF